MFPRTVVLLLAAALAVGFFARPSGGAGPERTYVVRPGDTLWSVSLLTYGGDVRKGVWELRRRNHLSAATIVPGQRLVVP
jgi:LysM repeat protein